MIVGTTRFPLRKFTIISLLITLPKTLIFILMGYYFGKFFDTNKYFQHANWIIFGAAVVVILATFVYTKISARFAKKIEKI